MALSTPWDRRWVIVHLNSRRGGTFPVGRPADCEPRDDRGLLGRAWDRATCLTDPERIITVLSPGAASPEEVLLAPGPVLEQPADIGGGVGILLGLAYIRAMDPEAMILSLPAGPAVQEEARLVQHLGQALDLAESLQDRVVLLGAVPDSPDGDADWIEPAAAPATTPMLSVRAIHVASGRDGDRHYLRGHLRDTGTVVAPSRLFWEEFLQAAPVTTARFEALATVLHAIRVLRAPAGHQDIALSHAYSGVEPWSLGQGLPITAPQSAVVIPLEGVRWCRPRATPASLVAERLLRAVS